MDASNLFPRVIPDSYFSGAGITDPLKEHFRLGFVRSIGHDVYSFLAFYDSTIFRNVHQEDLDALGLTLYEAEQRSLENLRSIAFDGQSIKQHLTKTESNDNNWCVWLGNELTSSCLLLPELFPWAVKYLDAEKFFVCVPSTQLLFLLQYNAEASLPAFDNYIANVVEGSNNLISSKWFSLAKDGLTHWTTEVNGIK
jgi:hypothetical protein